MSKRGPYTKKEKYTKNIYARYKLLQAGIAKPNGVSTKVMDSLQGQRLFAALEVKSSGIEPIALNTLKSIADGLLSRESPNGKGFEYLDSLRMELKRITVNNRKAHPKANKIQRDKETSLDIKQKLQQAELLNLQRAKAYGDLFSAVTTLTKEVALDEVVRLRLYNLLKDQRDLYAHLLSPSTAVTDEGDDSVSGALRVIPGGKND